MELDKRISKTFFLFLGMTLISAFLSIRPPMGSSMISTYSSYITIFLGGVTGILMFFFLTQLLLPGSGSMMSEEERIDSKPQGTADSTTPTQKKENFLSNLNLFGGKKRCNECGTELEYREEYQSHYCPQCRTYKGQK